MATDPLSTTVSSVKLLETLVEWVRKLRGQARPDRGPLGVIADKSLPLDFELVPQSFEISLGQPLPQLGLSLIAINYMKRAVLLDSIHVSQFQLAGCSTIDGPASSLNFEIPGHRSRYLLCRRTLLDPEVRLIAALEPRQCHNAVFTLSARYVLKGRLCQYEPRPILGINGWVLDHLVQHGISPAPRENPRQASAG